MSADRTLESRQDTKTAFDPKRTSKLSQSVIAKFAGALPDFNVGVTTD
jgi:hypothetical protein